MEGHEGYGIHTSHLRNPHRYILRDSIRPFLRQTRERIRRSKVDDDTAADISRSVPARPCLACLLAHCGDLGADAEEVAARVDAHYAVEIVHVCVCEFGGAAVVDLDVDGDGLEVLLVEGREFRLLTPAALTQ